jgi:ABC-type transport system involved in multi-copper enzyme maturation permease subunit
MLRDIIVKEIQDIIMSPKFVFTFLLCTILILLSIYTGINNYQSDMKEHSAAVALNQKNLENQQSWRLLAGLGVMVNRKPEVLGTVVSGVQEAVGRQSRVNTAIDPTMEDSKYSTSPIFAVFGALDLSFIVKIVLSLFAILFTFDAIVGEKERGTLKLALSNRVPKDKIILGKAIGGFVSLLIPLIIPMILGLLILMIYPNISLSGGDWARLGIICVMFLLYLSVFFTLGLFVSVRTSRSSTSFLLLLFIWVTFVTIIPKASIMIAGQIHPIPSVHEITAQKESYLQEIIKESDAERTRFLKENPVPKEADQRKKWEEDIRQWAEDLQTSLTNKIEERNMAIERDYQVKKQGQQKLAVNLSRISPASALMFSSMSLARTGLDDHDKFLNSVKSYKPIFSKWVNEKMMENLDLSGGLGPKPDLAGMPQHEYVPDSLSKSVVRVLPDVILMVFLIMFFFIGSYVSFIRYDVR